MSLVIMWRICCQGCSCLAYDIAEPDMPFFFRFQINVLSTGMLAHLILGDMANTGDAPEVRMKPHMVFVGAADHYDVEFAQKDAENVLKTLNDPSSYPNKESRPYELFKIEKRKLSCTFIVYRARLLN